MHFPLASRQSLIERRDGLVLIDRDDTRCPVTLQHRAMHTASQETAAFHSLDDSYDVKG
jgi:hypothetical protein